MRHVLALPLFLIIAPPLVAQQGQDPAAEAVTRLADTWVATILEWWPEVAAFQGTPDADPGAITDPSWKAVLEWEAREDAMHEQLLKIDASRLEGKPEWVTYGFLREALELGRQSRVCRSELWRVDQRYGWQVTYPLLGMEVQPLGTEVLREAALRRFARLPGYIDAEIANLREGLRRGYSAPRVTVERVLAQIDGLLQGPPEASPFYGLARRDSTGSFQTAVHDLVVGVINPAVVEYRDFLREEYLPQARTETAISANPDGAACYRTLTRAATSLDLSPEALHRLGLDAMEEILAEMHEIAMRSFATDDVPSLLARLRTDEQFLFGSGTEIREHAERAIVRARTATPAWFGELPEAELVIRPVPPHEEPSAPPGLYLPPAEDGSRPGIYQINLYRAEEQPRALLEDIVFHETIPGHHLQATMQRKRAQAHPISRYLTFTAVREGWAVYAERLADEMGLYSSDLQRLGMLSALAHRAARLVVDPGMHALGWTRQQAIDYMSTHTMLAPHVIESEVDRYIVTPGEATAFTVGYQEIRQARARARQELGETFDVAAFHDLVLADGAVTLPMLRAKVEQWIASRR